MQLPLGRALDRFGPRRMLLVLLALAVLGCAAFALATQLPGADRGAGADRRRVWRLPDGAADLLPAPLHARGAAARQFVDADDGLAGHGGVDAAGAVAAAAAGLARPVLGVAALLALAMAADRVPGCRADATAARPAPAAPARRRRLPRHRAPPAVRAHGAAGLLPLRRPDRGAVAVGRALADQVSAAGRADQAAQGLLLINLAMLFAFMAWGAVMPRLVRARLGAMQLMTWGLPLALLLLVVNVALGARGRRRALGAVVCGLHLRVAEPAGRRRRRSRPPGRPRAVGLQPGDLRRRVLHAVGHRAAIDALACAGAGREPRAFRLRLRRCSALCCVAGLAVVSAARGARRCR